MFRLIFLFMGCLIGTIGDGWAAEGQQLPLTVLSEPASAGIDDVCCKDDSAAAAPVRQVRSDYGGAPFWLRIDAPGSIGMLQFSPILDEVRVFYRKAGTAAWQEALTGDLVAMRDRAHGGPFMAFDMQARVIDTPIYARISQPVLVTIKAFAWRMVDFAAMERRDRSAKLFMFGILTATIIYNAFVGGLIRDIAFLLNALTITSLFLLALYLSGYGAAYVWAPWPQLSNLFLQTSLFGGVVFGGLFMWSFIRDGSETFLQGLAFLLPICSGLLAGLASPFLPYWIIQPWLLITAAVLLIVAIYVVAKRALWQQRKAAMILMVPLALAVIPGLSLVAAETLFGLNLSQLHHNLLEMTLCFEAILFSLAIASRVRAAELANRHMTMNLMALRAEGAAKTIAAQDSERQRLAKELHDGVGQDFLVVLGNLKRLAKASDGADWKTAMPGLITATTGALDELRRISKEMHPASITHLGLKKALELLFENLETANQIETDLQLDFNEQSLSADAKLHIYRIVQECLSNISRHAGASCCRASLLQDGVTMHLSIEDDGSGLSLTPAERPTKFGLGFTSIDERVRSLSGTWKMASSAMGGVLISVTFPVAERTREAPK